ncbi:MAG: hypothetical protein ACKVZJ_07550 [Phycisphaerales bacterium]
MNFIMMQKARTLRPPDAARRALGMLVILLGCGVASGGWEPPNPYRWMYAVGEDNQLYSRDRNIAGSLFEPILGYQAPAGEVIVGMDFSDSGAVWHLLSKSGKVYATEPGIGLVQLGGSAPVALQGESFGFDRDGDGLYVTTSAGQSLRFGLTSHTWSVRPSPVHNNGTPALLGGLAVFDGRGADRFIGLDLTDGTIVHFNPDAPGSFTPVEPEGPAQYFGPSGMEPLPLSGSVVAGFDAILHTPAYQLFPPPDFWFGGVALNNPNFTNTRLFEFHKTYPYQATGINFVPGVDMIAHGNPSLRFTAIAFSPTPGTAALFGAGLLLGVRRRRWVT